MAINGSSLQFDDEGTSDLTAEIYELDQTGAGTVDWTSIIDFVISLFLISRQSESILFRRVITARFGWELFVIATA